MPSKNRNKPRLPPVGKINAPGAKRKAKEDPNVAKRKQRKKQAEQIAADRAEKKKQKADARAAKQEEKAQRKKDGKRRCSSTDSTVPWPRRAVPKPPIERGLAG